MSRMRVLGGPLARAAGLATVYVVLSQAVQLVSALGDESSSTVFWPAAGVTVAVLLRRPRAEWPWLLAAVWLAETGLDLLNGFPPGVSASWGLANTAEPLVAAVLLRRRGHGPPDLLSLSSLLRFVGLAVVLAPVVGALIGTAATVALDGDVWWPRLPRWFIGDAVGVLTIAPALLLRDRLPVPSSVARSAGPVLVLLTATAVALAPWSPSSRVGLPYLVVPALVLIAIRVGGRGSTWAILLVSLVVQTSTASASGPFGGADARAGTIEAQIFLAVCAFTTLTVAALIAEVTERERAAAELRSASRRDVLTGLSNRRDLIERLRDHLLDERPAGGCVGPDGRAPTPALLFIDLDHFKAVNDAHGHQAGDEVLRTVATRLLAIMAEQDTVARLGGDEFVVLTEMRGDRDDHDDLDDLVQRIEAVICEPVPWLGRSLRVGASVGSYLVNGPVDDVERLLDEADRAMYRVKLGRALRTGLDKIPSRSPSVGSDVYAATPRPQGRGVGHGGH